MNTRGIILTIILAVAFAPVLFWYVARLDDGGGEPMGLLALIAALGLAIKDRHPANPRCAEVAVLLYGLGFLFLPPLLQAIPALLALAFLTGMHHRAGQVALLILSLPMQSSLDFFLGFPFRVMTAEGAQNILSTFGISIERLGVQLSLNGAIVSVDPPCSGLQMLWATGFFTAILAALFKLTYLRTFSLGLLALLLCLLANVLRATFLVFPEAKLISIPDFAHEGIGILFFALAALCLIKLARSLQMKGNHIEGHPRRIPGHLIATSVAVSLVTMVPAKTNHTPKPTGFIKLTEYRGVAVKKVALSSREEAFAKDFPGSLKVYQAGNETLILRHVTRATRKLHPSYHCFKAEGFSISRSGLQIADNGLLSTTYRATRGEERYSVEEIIRSADGCRHWPDVSAWYWHALFNPNSGPWVAETILTPITPTSP